MVKFHGKIGVKFHAIELCTHQRVGVGGCVVLGHEANKYVLLFSDEVRRFDAEQLAEVLPEALPLVDEEGRAAGGQGGHRVLVLEAVVDLVLADEERLGDAKHGMLHTRWAAHNAAAKVLRWKVLKRKHIIARTHNYFTEEINWHPGSFLCESLGYPK